MTVAYRGPTSDNTLFQELFQLLKVPAIGYENDPSFAQRLEENGRRKAQEKPDWGFIEKL